MHDDRGEHARANSAFRVGQDDSDLYRPRVGIELAGHIIDLALEEHTRKGIKPNCRLLAGLEKANVAFIRAAHDPDVGKIGNGVQPRIGIDEFAARQVAIHDDTGYRAGEGRACDVRVDLVTLPYDFLGLLIRKSQDMQGTLGVAHLGLGDFVVLLRAKEPEFQVK